jgi:endonuclease/exonuclease/phosphatase family metal-dependent hydrolase
MPELTIASFNTHYGLRPLRESCVPYDLATALTALGDPDVMVLQEVWRPDGALGVVDEYADAHGYRRHDVVLTRATMRTRWPRADADGEGTVAVSVLTRRPARVLDHPLVGPTPGDRIKDRRVLHLDLDVDGVAIDLVGVHLTSRLPHGPPLQLRRLARLLPANGRSGILAGDCNFWGPPASALLPGWRRAVRGRTWPAPRPHSQIDHVFVRGAIEVLDAQVLSTVGSDHRPVRARLRVGHLPERPG